MAEPDGFAEMSHIYADGGRLGVSRVLARLAPQTTWAGLDRAESVAVLAMEASRSRLVARLDQIEAEAAELRAEIDRRDAEIESIVSEALHRFDEDPGSGNVPLR